jgi:hypothetical protein
MTEEPMSKPEPADPDRHPDSGPSTDLVVPTRRPVVRSVRRRPDLAVRVRRHLEQLRQNPAAMAGVSAAATVGGALVTAALRGTLRKASLSPTGKPASVAIGGYLVHEVHVVHHVIHHVVRPPE